MPRAGTSLHSLSFREELLGTGIWGLPVPALSSGCCRVGGPEAAAPRGLPQPKTTAFTHPLPLEFTPRPRMISSNDLLCRPGPSLWPLRFPLPGTLGDVVSQGETSLLFCSIPSKKEASADTQPLPVCVLPSSPLQPFAPFLQPGHNRAGTRDLKPILVPIPSPP